MPVIERMLRIGSGKRLKQYQHRIAAIAAWEAELELADQDELRARIDEMRQEVVDGRSLDDLLVECFAIVRETARRTLGMRHFDVQMIGGMVIHDGAIAEMRTGEGKTLTATLPVSLNALTGRGVHLVTVNDYLARRDAQWMAPVYEALGLTIGVIQSGQSDEEKRAAYQADITYGTNSEFGFDYLRDNLAWQREEQVQRGAVFAIVDEVDNILIDEARTPLIISGAPEGDGELYATFARVASQMQIGERPEGYNPRIHREWNADFDYEIDEKHKTVSITDRGVATVERLLGIDHLYRADSSHLVNHLVQALKAQALYRRDKDYAVIEGEVQIIDEFTGRILEGRRWSEGLHQAIEAKEGVAVQAENQTVASITYQNFFRRYDKLAGMTGTAITEATELNKIYRLEVVEIPPNRAVARNDFNDVVFATAEAKWKAVADDISQHHKNGQPVLVGTVSVEDSELLSSRLQRLGIDHTVLNAKPEYAEREGVTIAQAGRLGAVTIATNMAGRGVDIKLGGDPEGLAEQELSALRIESDDEEYERRRVKLLTAFAEGAAAEAAQVRECGGLAIIGTERHESRRIDNQLRGRSGRQGDPGTTRFYLSAEDDLLRLFGGDWMKKTLLALGGEEQPVEHRLLSKRIEGAQKRVEEQRFLERKNVIEYDDVMNEQREAVYAWRAQVLDGDDLSEQIHARLDQVIAGVVDQYTASEYVEEWDSEALLARLIDLYPTEMTIERIVGAGDRSTLINALQAEARARYDEREERVGREHMRRFERLLVLQVLDERWREHLHDMDYLRDSIHLRGFAQIEPLVAYKNEAAGFFQNLIRDVWEQFMQLVYRVDFDVHEGDQLVASTRLVLGEPAGSGEAESEPKLNRQQRRAQERAARKASKRG